MKTGYSPRQVARAVGVSEASIKRWCDQGSISFMRTPGGHRRLAVHEVIQFLRTTCRIPVRPDLLGLPPFTRGMEARLEGYSPQVRDILIEGSRGKLWQVIFGLYLKGNAATDIMDRVMARAFHELGDRWECGEVEVYEERRGCEIAGRVLDDLRDSLPSLPENALRAIGGTLEGDYYAIPNRMVEVTLHEAGWRADTVGTHLPGSTLVAALVKEKPDLFWVSASHMESENEFIQGYQELFRELEEHDIPVAVGGRALTEPIRRQIKYTVFCDNLAHLLTFAQTLRRSLEARREEDAH